MTTTMPMPDAVTPGEPNGYDEGKIAHVVTVSKLSRLQKHILHLALENRSREGRGDTLSGADLYYVEIMVAHFGFQVDCYKDLRKYQGSHRFQPEEIGRAKYAAAAAAISRAARRLRNRGLVIWMNGAIARWSGVSLTPEGVKAAPAAGARRGDAAVSLEARRCVPARGRGTLDEA